MRSKRVKTVEKYHYGPNITIVHKRTHVVCDWCGDAIDMPSTRFAKGDRETRRALRRGRARIVRPRRRASGHDVVLAALNDPTSPKSFWMKPWVSRGQRIICNHPTHPNNQGEKS